MRYENLFTYFKSTKKSGNFEGKELKYDHFLSKSFIVAEWTLNLIPPLDFPDKAKYYGQTANHLAVSFSHFFIMTV